MTTHQKRCELCRNDTCEYNPDNTEAYFVDQADKTRTLFPEVVDIHEFIGKYGCASFRKKPELTNIEARLLHVFVGNQLTGNEWLDKNQIREQDHEIKDSSVYSYCGRLVDKGLLERKYPKSLRKTTHGQEWRLKQ